MRFRFAYSLAVASLIAAPVAWYVWTEQSPLERDLVLLAKEFGLDELSPESAGYASDNEYDYRVFATQEITVAAAKTMAKRFDELDKKHAGEHIFRCLTGEGFDERIFFSRKCFVFHGGGITHFWLYSENAAPNRFILSIRKERTTPAQRFQSTFRAGP